jgi:DNA-binding response OmpR family regulator
VEDDRLIAELERDYLDANGFSAEIALTGTDGFKMATTNDYDTILLDIMLPGMNGFDICREIRKNSNVPIIMVTAKREDIDKIRGLGLGADDYLLKPFNPGELVARVKAHINVHERLKDETRSDKVESHKINIGELEIRPEEYRVYRSGEEISLTAKEFELLLFLAENPNIVFSKDVLFERIWGFDSVGDTATVTVHINRLRQKIEENASDPKYIVTVWGAGYKFKV